MRAAVVAIGLGAGLASTVVNALPCADAGPQRRADAIAALRNDLATQPIGDPTVVPVAVGRELEALKDELQALTAEVISCVPPEPVPDAVARRLQSLVPDAAAGDQNAYLRLDDPKSAYGRSIRFTVRVDTATTARLAVTTDIGIQCGEDALLAVFEPVGDGWRERLRWRAPPYDSIARAHGSLRFALAPAARDGRWHLIAAVNTPWCSSAWSTLHYVVLRPGVSADLPQVLLDRQHSYWLSGDEDEGPYATADGVELRFRGGSIDPGVLVRRFIHRYRFDGERLRRVPPVAESARDFVDEWIVAEPEDAMAWTAPAARARLSPLKTIFSGEHGEAMEFGAPTTCPDGVRRIAVHRVDHDDTWYFGVRRTGDAFELIDAGTEADRRCVGDPSPETPEQKQSPASTP